MRRQMEQMAKRQAEEEAEEVRKRGKVARSSKTEGDVKSARERYLERKRLREEEGKEG